jgi:antitoxin ParD1/3/4
VIQQALEAKRREDEDYEAWKAGFFETLHKRSEGPFVSEEEFRLRVDEMLAEESARLGLED